MALKTASFFLSFFFFSAMAGAMLQSKLPVYYTVTKTASDETLKKNEAVFKFHFQKTDKDFSGEVIRFSIDGKEQKVRADAQGSFSFKARPGKHKFQFFYDVKHLEVTTEEIAIGSSQVIEVNVHLEPSLMETVVDKPVIYVYPKTTTDVRVSLEVKGKLSFAYPEYRDGWRFTADPDGTLHFEDKKFNYLFWDGVLDLNSEDFGREDGFVVEKKDLLSFLEAKLTQMGFNSKESQDFITYWYPRMSANDVSYVRFLFNEDCDTYAKMTVVPQPDRVFRVYMLWSKADHAEKAGLKEQVLPRFQREGFSVLEWGGSEIK